jgi:hypothetical protein
MNAHVFVDESKSRGYLLAAAIVPPQDLARMRKLLGALRLPRQRRIHFTGESDARRKMILRSLTDAGVQVTIYDASSYVQVKDARDAAMTRLVDDAAKIGASMLLIEREDGTLRSDCAIIRARTERAGCRDSLRFAHVRAYEECLLAIPDAVAWSWAKGGHWRQRAQLLVAQAVNV